MSLNESIVNNAALGGFDGLGFAVGHGPRLAPGEPAVERDSLSEVVLVDTAMPRLRSGVEAQRTI